jgi:subfamily B ATP-binding cassette protein MsbA
VIENGKVVEQGNHQELVAQEGLYQKLITMQSFSS